MTDSLSKWRSGSFENGSNGLTWRAQAGVLTRPQRSASACSCPGALRTPWKRERRFTGFDDKILAICARGMTVREIQAFLAEMYAVEVSPDLISTVTDAVVAEVTASQSRPGNQA